MLLVLAGLLAGCSHAQQAAQTQPPLLIDQAMEKRDWNRSVCYYQSGAVVAWHKRFHYIPSASRPDRLGVVIEPVFFVGETLLLPVTLFTEPVGQHEVYRAFPPTPPTYTGVPPLPPSRQQRPSQSPAGVGPYGARTSAQD